MGMTMDVSLEDGIKVGDDTLKDAVLRELTGADLIDGQAEAERLVQTPAGPALVASPAAMGVALLRRQVVRIGNLQGPLEVADLRKLSARDLNTLQEKAEALDAANAKALADEVATRGRDDGVGAQG